MKKIYFVCLGLLYLSACKKWDKSEQIPSYIFIDHIDFTVLPTQGTASNGIIDAWVYVNDQPLGVFDLPCTIPVLSSGFQEIKVFPGIKDNGLTENRKKYTLLQEYVTNAVELKPGEIANLTGANQPVVTYLPSSKIDIWNENFDNAAIDFTADPNSEAGITFIGDTNLAFEGPGMGEIVIPDGLTYARVLTSQTFTLPKQGKQVYIELNYNTNNGMSIGAQAITGTDLNSLDFAVLNATNGVWKKIYVNLTDLISGQANTSTFKFIITCYKETGVSVVENYIDNFKVVYVK